MASEEAPEGIPGLRYDRRAALAFQRSLGWDLGLHLSESQDGGSKKTMTRTTAGTIEAATRRSAGSRRRNAPE